MAGLDVFDLNEVGKKYVQTLLDASDGKKAKSARGNITLDWNRVKFETKVPIFPELGETPDPKWVGVLKATFVNDSDEPQENTFSEEKTTTASTHVSLHQSFSIGEQTRLQLKLPAEICAAESVFGHNLSVSHVNSQLFETQQTWTVNTKVLVPPRSQRRATLKIRETQVASPFNVETVISGKVHVTVEGENAPFVEPKDISEIITHLRQHNLYTIPDFVEVKGRTVRITTKGRCEFVYAIEHRVTTEKQE